MLRAALILMVLVGCEGSMQTDDAFLAPYGVDDVNETITLEPLSDDSGGSLAAGSISLVIRNHSNGVILFPADYGVQAFVYDNTSGSWSELMNSIIYPPVQRVLGPETLDMPELGFVDFRPMESSLAEGTTVRVIALGNLLEADDELGPPVLAYLDVRILR